jgi:hypothetical protein
MSRLIFFLLVAAVAVMAVRRLGGSRPAPARAARRGERIVACHMCGLNVPESDAVAVRGPDGASAAWACCPAHAKGPAQRL